MTIRVTFCTLAAVAALALTGCVNNAAESAPKPEGPAIAVDTAAAALVPDDVRASGKLVIGTDASSAPNEYKDANGVPIGWGVELTDAISARLDLTPVWQVSSFDSIIPSITGGKMQLGASSFTDNVEREKSVDFVNYYEAGIMWAAQKGKPVNPDDACGLKVSVQAGTVQEMEELPAKSEACLAAGKPAIEIIKYDVQEEAINAVALGKTDALSADSPIVLYAIAQTKDKLEPAGEVFEVAPYGFVTAKGSEMTRAVQAALQSLMDDGTYDAILGKVGIDSGRLSTATINAAGGAE